MLNVAIALLVIAAGLGIAIGVKYLRVTTFMPYQATVVGRSWGEFDPAVQAIILGMLRIIGGSLAGLGVTVLWLCVAIHQGARWAPWAIFSTSAITLGPSLYVALDLRAFRPGAKTPVAPTLAAIALIVVGVGLSAFALA